MSKSIIKICQFFAIKMKIKSINNIDLISNIGSFYYLESFLNDFQHVITLSRMYIRSHPKRPG